MEPYFIWKGISSLDKNIMVTKLPDFEIPEADIEMITVPGRDGFLTLDNGTFQGKVKKCECALDNGNIEDLSLWLRGSSEVIFSNKPDRKYKAVIINKIPFDKVIPIFHNFIIQFDCQPFANSTDTSIIAMNVAGSINNPGYDSKPYIKVTGSGNITLTINSKNIILTGVSGYIEIDSEMLNCFKGTSNANNQMQGEFPILVSGTNTISWTGTVTNVEIAPRWGWPI